MKNTIKSFIALAMIIQSLSGYSQMTEKLTSKKVLFVLTNVNVAPSNGAAIGLWLEEFAAPYYILKDKGIQVTLASPKGGVSPVDLRSSSEGAATVYTKRFLTDTDAQKELYHTLPLKEIDPTAYDAVFYPGGRGPMWDLPEDVYSRQIIESMFAAGKPISFVCHGPVALKHAKDKNGVLIVKGKKVAAYTNTEEQANNTAGGVPYSLQDMLTSSGALYQKGEDFKPFVLQDGTLITGQNPRSSSQVAELLMASLTSKK